MKKIIVLLAFLVTSTLFSQSLVLDITYTRIENDKNRSTRTETFSINGSSSAYSLKYDGRVLPNEMDEQKVCELTQNAVNEISSSISENKVAANESFYAKEKTNGEGTFYLLMKVNMVYDGTPYEIILDGEANLVMGNKMYLKVIELIKDLRRIIKNC